METNRHLDPRWHPNGPVTISGLATIIVGLFMLAIPFAEYIGFLVCLFGLSTLQSELKFFHKLERPDFSSNFKLAGFSTLLIIVLPPIFLFLARSQIYPTPEVITSAAKESAFNISFLVYFYLTKIAFVLFLLSLSLAVAKLSNKFEQRVILISSLLTVAVIIFTIIALTPTSVLPYNAWNGFPAGQNAFVNKEIIFPSEYQIYLVFPFAVFSYALVSIRRRIMSAGRSYAGPDS